MAPRKPDPLPWWEVTPERFPRSLLGIRFRWPVWWEWFILVTWYIVALRTGWYWLTPLLWPLLLLRLGALLSYRTPMRSSMVALLVLMGVNLITLGTAMGAIALAISAF